MSNLAVNKSVMRKWLLDYAANSRAHKFTGVAGSVYLEGHAALVAWMRRKVDAAPSKGKRIH